MLVNVPPDSEKGPFTVIAAALPLNVEPDWVQPAAPTVIDRPAPCVTEPP